VYGGGDSVSPALLAILPVVLLGGLAAGFFIPFNGTSLAGGGTPNVNTIVNINGTSIGNLFQTTNMAMATNTNNDMDMIMNMNTNMNQNNPMAMARSFRSWRSWGSRLRTTAMDLMATTTVTFYDDFMRSAGSVSYWEVLEAVRLPLNGAILGANF